MCVCVCVFVWIYNDMWYIIEPYLDIFGQQFFGSQQLPKPFLLRPSLGPGHHDFRPNIVATLRGSYGNSRPVFNRGSL